MKLFLSVIGFLLLVSCGSNDKKAKFDTASYESTKETLIDKEQKNPLRFLKIEGHDHKNFFTFGKTVIKGEITNSATLCAYKDVRVKMLCYDRDGRMVEEHEDVMDDAVEPNGSIHFKTKYRLPKSTDSIALSIMSATPVAK